MDGDVTGVDLEHVNVSSGPSSVNVYNNQQRRRHSSLSLEDRVMDLERMVYGEERWSEPGLIKRQQRQLWISQANAVMNAITLIVIAVYLVWLVW